MLIIGTFYCSIDDKGRILLPKEFITQIMPIENKKFVIKKSTYHHCLEFYTMDEWNIFMEDFKKFDKHDKLAQAVVRKFTHNHRAVEILSNRIQIPKDIKESVFFVKDIVIAPVMDKVEIWDKKLYLEQEEAIDDYYSLYKEVKEMNDKKNNKEI